MASAPFKRKAIDLESKFNALQEVDRGGSTKQSIAERYGVKANTLSTWLSNRKAIEEAYANQTFGPKRKRMRLGNFENLDAAMVSWLREVRSRDVRISGDLLASTAVKMAEELGITDFKGSRGWLEGWKTRNGIKLRTISGEAKTADAAAADVWRTTILPGLLEEYGPNCIYNADETGLFWKMQPKQSLICKGEDGRGGKGSKERVTILLAANMSGTDKLKPLVINKSLRPRAFGRNRSRSASLPVDWEANKSAWMTAEIFTRWLTKLDRKFHQAGKKIALVLDNATCHPQDIPNVLKSIKLVFLPPNTTSVVQPMDQGIICNFKRKFKAIYSQVLVEKGPWDILKVCFAIQKDWDL